MKRNAARKRLVDAGKRRGKRYVASRVKIVSLPHGPDERPPEKPHGFERKEVGYGRGAAVEIAFRRVTEGVKALTGREKGRHRERERGIDDRHRRIGSSVSEGDLFARFKFSEHDPGVGLRPGPRGGGDEERGKRRVRRAPAAARAAPHVVPDVAFVHRRHGDRLRDVESRASAESRHEVNAFAACEGRGLHDERVGRVRKDAVEQDDFDVAGREKRLHAVKKARTKERTARRSDKERLLSRHRELCKTLERARPEDDSGRQGEFKEIGADAHLA